MMCSCTWACHPIFRLPQSSSACMHAKSLQSCDPMGCIGGIRPWGFSRQEYWSGLLCPPPGDLPDPGIETMSLTSPALSDVFFTTSATWEALELL